MPQHNHLLNAYSEAGDVGSPANALLASTGALDPEYRTSGTLVQMGGTAVNIAGGNQPHENRQPYLAINYSICLNGLFPSRN